MSNSRPFLLMALCLVGYLLWQAWQQDHAVAPPASTTPSTSVVETDVSTAEVPKAPSSDPAAATPPAPTSLTPSPPLSASRRIEVTTDLLKLEIDTRGGSIVSAKLLAYPIDPGKMENPVRLLSDEPANLFEAQTGLISNASLVPDHQAIFSAERINYELAAGNNTLEIPLTWQDASGIKVRKIYSLKRGSYQIDERQEIDNGSDKPWVGNEYRQLVRVIPPQPSGGMFSFNNPERYAFVGAAWYTPTKKFDKRAFDKFGAKAIDMPEPVAGGWIAMLQHYFFAAWIPPAEEVSTFSTVPLPGGAPQRFAIRAISPALTIAPGETKSIGARLYVGPKLQSDLAAVAPGLQLTVDYGMFTVIAEPLHFILSWFKALTGNWGFAIILLVLSLKLAFYKLSEAQYRSMAKMRKLQPRIEALKERYGDDTQKKNAAMMELYQKEKINPVGGCLPMLLQFPVFIALYWVLLESVELRHAPFIGWIHNLTAPDPYFVLPVLNGIAMIAGQRLSPTTGMDPMQAKMMQAMPIVFSVMFAFFPAGLVLYWTVNGTLSLIQQLVITRRIEGAKAS